MGNEAKTEILAILKNNLSDINVSTSSNIKTYSFKISGGKLLEMNNAGIKIELKSEIPPSNDQVDEDTNYAITKDTQFDDDDKKKEETASEPTVESKPEIQPKPSTPSKDSKP